MPRMTIPALTAAGATLLLTGCGTVATAAAVTSATVGAATTVAGIAVDGAEVVGKGVVKAGEAAKEAVTK